MDYLKRILELAGVKTPNITVLNLMESQNLKEDIDLYEALKLQHNKEKQLLVVLSDHSDPKAATGETYKNKAMFKANGFKWDGSNWTIPLGDLEHAKNIISKANKIEYIIDKLEDLEEYVLGSPSSPDKNTVLSKIEGYINKLASETDERRASQEIQKYLTFGSQFHNYSFNNRLLIYIQKPNATRVAGFKKWAELGRGCKKGQSITIYRPNMKKEKDDQGIERDVLLGYAQTSVWDISDTYVLTGKTDLVPQTPTWWGSNDPHDTAEMIFELVQKAAESDGITITQEHSKGSEHGYSSGGHINISSSVQGAEKASVMIHEYAHELMHWRDKSKFYAGDEVKKSRAIKELQAESVAYIVLSHYDIPSSHNATYLALWDAKGDVIKKNMELLQKVAYHIIKGIDKQAGTEHAEEDDFSEINLESVVNFVLYGDKSRKLM